MNGMKKLIIATMLSVLISGCGPKELSPEQTQLMESLKSELKKTDGDIDSSVKQEEVSGGLIEALISSRIEILKTNKALIEQRINALESGAKIDIVISATNPDPKLASELTSEMEKLSGEISLAKKDAEQYSGGILYAMKLATVATREQSMAMLQQKLLSAKYGLAIPVVKKPVNSSSKLTAVQEENKKEALIPPGVGPFGLQIGLTKQIIEDMTGVELNLVDEDSNLYTTDSVPKKNSDFDSFGLVISPVVGLCQIRAISDETSTDSHGLTIKSKVENISASLTSIYGKGKVTDVLLPGSIWREPRDWMMGIYKEERYFGTEWKGTKEHPLKNDLQSIVIQARSSGSDSGRVYLQYNFKNIDECIKEKKSKQSSSL